MIFPVAFCSCAALDEDCMNGMTCCNMNTKKFEGLGTSIGRVVVVVDEEEARSVRDQL